MAQLFSDSDIFCLPSIDTDEAVEGAPLSLYEAIASGVYVVVADSGASAPDIVGQSFGEIFDAGNSFELASRLDKLARTPGSLEWVRAHGLATAREGYSYDASANRIIQLCRIQKSSPHL